MQQLPEIDVLHIKMGKRLWLLSDLHIDASAFKRDAFEKAKKMVGKDPVILLGDVLDYGFFNNVKSQIERQMVADGEYSREEMKSRVGIEAMLKVDDILDTLNLKAVCEGNHDIRAAKLTGENFLKYACYKRGIAFCPGELLVIVECGKKANSDARFFRFLFTHGSRGGRKQASPINELEDIWNGWAGLDLIAIGHHHKNGHTKIARGYIEKNIPKIQATHLVAVPSFLGLEEYAQKRGYKPQPSEIVRIDFTPSTGRIDICFEEVD